MPTWVWALSVSRETTDGEDLPNIKAVYRTHEAALDRVDRMIKANKGSRLSILAEGRVWVLHPPAGMSGGFFGARPVTIRIHQAPLH